MSKLAKGDRAKLLRRTFLHQGIFIHQNSTVEIESVDDEITVQYRDQEGHLHSIAGFKEDELEKIG